MSASGGERNKKKTSSDIGLKGNVGKKANSLQLKGEKGYNERTYKGMLAKNAGQKGDR